MPSQASIMAQEGPSLTIFSLDAATRRPRRAFFIKPRICRVPCVKVPQVSVVTKTRALSSASSLLRPALTMAAIQKAFRSSGRMLLSGESVMHGANLGKSFSGPLCCPGASPGHWFHFSIFLDHH